MNTLALVGPVDEARWLTEVCSSHILIDKVVEIPDGASVKGAISTETDDLDRWDVLLAREDVDGVVFVGDPIVLLERLQETPLVDGRFLVRGPFGSTTDTALDTLRKLVSMKQTVLPVFELRFSPSVSRMRVMIGENLIGLPAVARLSRVGPRPVGCEKSMLAASVLDDLDCLVSLFGNPVRVFASGLRDSKDLEATDYLQSIIRFESGVMAFLEHSWRHTGSHFGLEVAGSEGLIRHDSERTASIAHNSNLTVSEWHPVLERDGAFRGQLDALLDSTVTEIVDVQILSALTNALDQSFRGQCSVTI